MPVPPRPAAPSTAGTARRPDRTTTPRRVGRTGRGVGDGLQVLAGVGDRVDGARGAALALLLDDRADEDDALALLAADARPVVGVGGVGQVLVLLELVDARREEVVDADAALTGGEEVLDRGLLGAVHDV